MGKYSDEVRVAAARDYCTGHLGLKQVAKRHRVDVTSLRVWAAAYRVHGSAGVRAKKRKYFSAEFKLSVIRRIQSEKLSYRQAGALFDIRNRDMIAIWQRAYELGGIAALSPHSSIRRIAMSKQADPEAEANQADDETRTRQEFLEELQRLRMENAYLKNLKALAQADEKPAHDKEPRVVLELRQQYPLTGLLRVAGLARSSFYYHRKLMWASDKYASLKARIRTIFDRHLGRYGYRRITAALRREGSVVNHKTVQRLMGSMGLKSCVRPKKYRAYHGEVGLAAPNVLERKFTAERPNQKWVTDVTEFSVGGQKLYLSPVLDLYNGEIVAYELAQRPLFGMIGSMLRRAFARLGSGDKPVLHSDQGWQYRMPVYRELLQQRAITQSMSRRGNCLDNAAMESFFGTLKAEFYHLNRFRGLDELTTGLRQYIQYYNHERIKLKLGGLSPVEYRTRLAAA